MDDAQQKLARRLKEARQACGLTQAQVGKVLGVTYQMVQKYEMAQSTLSALKLQQLAQLLQRPVAWFLE